MDERRNSRIGWRIITLSYRREATAYRGTRLTEEQCLLGNNAYRGTRLTDEQGGEASGLPGDDAARTSPGRWFTVEVVSDRFLADLSSEHQQRTAEADVGRGRQQRVSASAETPAIV
jgi:hypothetical protein